MSIRVLIVDDHGIVRHGLARSIQQQEDMEVVGQATDGHSAVQLTRELSPNVVLMDVSMPDLNGIEATREIVRESPGTRVSIVSGRSTGLPGFTGARPTAHFTGPRPSTITS